VGEMIKRVSIFIGVYYNTNMDLSHFIHRVRTYTRRVYPQKTKSPDIVYTDSQIKLMEQLIENAKKIAKYKNDERKKMELQKERKKLQRKLLGINSSVSVSKSKSKSKSRRNNSS
jgi:hypothetical protein